MKPALRHEKWRLLRAPEDQSPICGLVFDIDDTLYHDPAYHEAGTQGEVAEIAKILCRSHNETALLIAERRQELKNELGRPVATTEIVLSLGVTRRQWNELRCRAWHPEEWLIADIGICNMLLRLSGAYRIAFGTNSPVSLGRRVLDAIGISAALPDIPVFGPESFSVSKPSPDFFARIAGELGLTPDQCVSIGDREETDGVPAIMAGFGNALIVFGGRREIIKIVPKIFTRYKGDIE